MKTARNFLVTGAGSGLGRSMCLWFAAEGHGVFATDLDLDAAQQTVEQIGGGNATAHALDVCNPEEIDRFLADLGDRSVDVLVNNAGIQHVSPLESFPLERWDRVVQVILHGTCYLTRALLPRMRAAGYGRIVNTGSVMSLVATPYKTAYASAKHALLGFSKALALETADADITVNTICPAYVRTPLVDGQIADQARSHGIPEDQVVQEVMMKPMPKGVFITPAEIAATVVFLASDYARNITGQAICIDGGWTCQ